MMKWNWNIKAKSWIGDSVYTNGDPATWQSLTESVISKYSDDKLYDI